MGQFDIPLSMPGGFKSVTDAKAHRSLLAKLNEHRATATNLAEDMRKADVVEIGSAASDLDTDLAAGKGHVIMLRQPEGKPLLGLELNYNPADNSTKHMVVEAENDKLTQASSTFKLEEGEGDQRVTTYFKYDDNRGVVSVLDLNSDVPRILGDADPNKLIGKTLQGGIPIFAF